MRNPGWRRLWSVVTAILLISYAVMGLADRNVRQATGSSWYCVPGTKSDEMVEQYAGRFEPPNWMIQKKVAEIRALSGQDQGILDEIAAKGLLEHDLTKTVPAFTCTSYSNVLSAIAFAALVSIAIAAAFSVIRWVIEGFRKTDDAASH